MFVCMQMTMPQSSSAFKRFGAIGMVLFTGLVVCTMVLSNRSLHKVCEIHVSMLLPRHAITTVSDPEALIRPMHASSTVSTLGTDQATICICPTVRTIGHSMWLVRLKHVLRLFLTALLLVVTWMHREGLVLKLTRPCTLTDGVGVDTDSC